jgi:hypothetical protein
MLRRHYESPVETCKVNIQKNVLKCELPGGIPMPQYLQEVSDLSTRQIVLERAKISRIASDRRADQWEGC